jgi:hypothetical protein
VVTEGAKDKTKRINSSAKGLGEAKTSPLRSAFITPPLLIFLDSFLLQ